jgi:predicted lipoprotein with Yx(FWY)xxD motif
MEDIVIRRNRMAIGAIGGMAVALALAGCGAQGNQGAVPRNAAAAGGAQTADGSQTPPLEVPLPGSGADAPGDPTLPDPNAPADPAGGAANAAPTDSSVTLIAKNIPKMGDVITDARGFVLYRFDKDSANPPKSNCNGACLAKWPAVTAKGTPVLQGIDPSIVGLVTRSDGKQQVTINGWPVYRFGADPAPGKWKGQGVGNTWWVISPDGKRNLTCIPKGATPPSDTGAGDTGAKSDPNAGGSSGDTSSSGGY